MKFISQSIFDLKIIIPDLHHDERGVFRRSFCDAEFKKNQLDFRVCQGNISENFKNGCIGIDIISFLYFSVNLYIFFVLMKFL